jgi:cell division septum initiation protein DivIVA
LKVNRNAIKKLIENEYENFHHENEQLSQEKEILLKGLKYSIKIEK